MSSCSINNKIYEWKIQGIPTLFDLLYENTETSGIFGIDTKNKTTTKQITRIRGSKASVEAPESIINYHSHPASCYLTEKTIWGFPSGEDTRESILFGFKGSVAHFVIAVEGTYVCQVNPNLLYNLIHLNVPEESVPPKVLSIIKKYNYNLNDFYRGLIILCIEVYFRSTHAFRTSSFVKKYFADPDDYINFVNNFTLKNIFSNEPIKGCTKIKCDKVWTFEKKLKQVSFENYVDDYEYKEKVYVCTKSGTIYISSIKLTSFIKMGGLEPLKTYDLMLFKKYKEIKTDNWFLTKLYKHSINGTPYVKYSNDDKIKILQTIAKRKKLDISLVEEPVFYFYEILGSSCNHIGIKKNILEHENNFGPKKTNEALIFYGSDECPHCITFLDSIKNSKDFTIKVNKYPTIEQAIDNASKYSGKEISSVPSVFHDKKLIDHNILLKRNIIVYKL
jgi:hypothetical protein